VGLLASSVPCALIFTIWLYSSTPSYSGHGTVLKRRQKGYLRQHFAFLFNPLSQSKSPGNAVSSSPLPVLLRTRKDALADKGNKNMGARHLVLVVQYPPIPHRLVVRISPSHRSRLAGARTYFINLQQGMRSCLSDDEDMMLAPQLVQSLDIKVPVGHPGASSSSKLRASVNDRKSSRGRDGKNQQTIKATKHVKWQMELMRDEESMSQSINQST
jgi:hypothetical protein